MSKNEMSEVYFVLLKKKLSSTCTYSEPRVEMSSWKEWDECLYSWVGICLPQSSRP